MLERERRGRRATLLPAFETVALDVDDMRLSARKGVLRVLGKGERLREIPVHPQLRAALTNWLEERRNWAGAAGSSALFPIAAAVG